MSVTRDAMYALFENSPGDTAAYGAMGDELDELGYAQLAHAFRWMARRGIWPHKRERYKGGSVPGRKVSRQHRWAWYETGWNHDGNRLVPGVYPDAKLIHHALPHLLMTGTQKVFPSHQAAVMWLAERLQKLRAIYEVDEPKTPGV